MAGLLPMKVKNIAFLVDKLGEDCHPLQFVRELTHNAIQAIDRTPGRTGTIIWDATSAFGGTKLSITDNGDGMNGEQLRDLINQLAASCYEQGRHGNFGIGAKIAAATRNPFGLVYQSWRDGRGSMIWLHRDPERNEYGLMPLETGGDRFAYCLDLNPDEPSAKHEIIEQHGTTVVLMGRAEEEDTTKPPQVEEALNPSRWLAYYLNRRYFVIPEGVTIKARSENGGLLTVRGQRFFLDGHSSEGRGTVQIEGAKIHWWIVDENGATSGEYFFRHHVATLYQGEVYGALTGRGAAGRLQQFGIVVGYQRVVLYVQPEGDGISPNTARTDLRLKGEDLPWDSWAAEFRRRLPKEIVHLMERINAASEAKDNAKSIRDRLKKLYSSFRIGRYKPAPQGADSLSGLPVSGNASSAGGTGTCGTQIGTRATKSANVLAKLRRRGDDAETGTKQQTDIFPTCQWVSVAKQSRAPGTIEDRAARYLPEQNRIQINADFRGFQAILKVWQDKFAGAPGSEPIIDETVREWIAQALIEAVVAVRLMDGPEWTPDVIERALSEEALTTVVMSRYHMHNAIAKTLGTKLRVGDLAAAT